MKNWIAVILLLVLAVSAYGQDFISWQMAEPVVSDARSSALGHAEIFGGLDGNAMFANPAWMANTHDLNVSFGGSSRFGSIDNPQLSHYYEDLNQSYTGAFVPEYVTAALPLRIKPIPISFAVGVGIWTMHRQGWDYEYEGTDEDGTSTDTYKYNGTLQAAGPSVAVDLFDMLFAGVTVATCATSEVSMENTYVYESDNSSSESSDNIYATPTFDVAILSGVLKPNENLKFGVMIRPAYDIEYTDIKLESDGGTLYMNDGTITMPGTVGFSFSLTTDDQMVELLAEYQTRYWSMLEFDGSFDEYNDYKFEDGQALRLGLQLGAIQFGYFMEDVIADASLYETMSPITRSGLTFGIGYRGKRISLHGFGEYGWMNTEYETVDEWGYVYTETIDHTIWRVGVGMGIHLF